MNKVKPILFKTNDECCGCSACETVCPKNAIHFEYNDEGFLYPKVDANKCIGCLLCERVCAFKNDTNNPIEEKKSIDIYAARLKEEDDVIKSSSGGLFTALSDYYLEKNYAVASCKYSYETNSVSLFLILDKKSRNEARGSKYIQAELGESFGNIIAYLNENKDKKIMVFGTGCQIAGLDILLKQKGLRKRALLIDLICHGTPSSGLWKKYINELEKEQKGKLDYITFKDKRNGWESPSTYAIINGEETSIKPYSDWFYMGWSLRESCYNCPYTRIDRNSDITIGDYWGIQKYVPSFYHKNGVSLVIVHSNEGKELFNSIKNNIDFISSDRENCLQPRLISPQIRPNDRDLFWNDMKNKGLSYCIDNYVEHYEKSFRESFKQKIVNFIKLFKK